MRILIVEDDHDARTLCKKALRAEGHEIHEAATGLEALKQLESQNLPDLILLDLSMPDMNGEQLVNSVKSKPEWENIRIVLVSGWDDLRSRARQMGVQDILRKPFDLDELYEMIERYEKC